MTTSRSLHHAHTKLLQAQARGENLKPVLIELSRLVVAAIEHANQLEALIADIPTLLALQRQIGALWNTDDVKGIRPDLTDDQAWDVLQAVDSRHDAERGICWDTLEAMADEMFPVKEDVA